MLNPEANIDDLVNNKKEKTHPSEARIAEIFVERHGDEFRYVSEWGVWMNWDVNRWRQEKTLLVGDKIKTICSELVARLRQEPRGQGSAQVLHHLRRGEDRALGPPRMA